MATYSHSRISTFENCPYQYKLKYIDKVKVDVPTTIECFMGDLVLLEKLYKDKKFKKLVSKATLLKFYKDLWEREYSEDILVVKANRGLTSDNYKKMGVKFIEDYYDKFKPFDQLTILGLETTDRMTLPDGNQWHVRIDTCGWNSHIYLVWYCRSINLTRDIFTMDRSSIDSLFYSVFNCRYFFTISKKE